MPRSYTPAQRISGLVIGMLLTGGFSVLLWAALAGRLTAVKSDDVWAVASFSAMMAIIGLSGICRLVVVDHAVPRAISAGLFGLGFAIFAGMFIAIAVLHGDEITGGIPFLPRAVNAWIGRILFAAVGLGVLALLPMVVRHKYQRD